MGLKWPKNGPPAILGHFGPILGVLGRGPATRKLVHPNVEILAFLASFRAILAVFWAVFAPFGPFWAFFRPFMAPFGPSLTFEPGGKLPLVGLGIVTELYRCAPPPGGML